MTELENLNNRLERYERMSETLGSRLPEGVKNEIKKIKDIKTILLRKQKLEKLNNFPKK